MGCVLGERTAISGSSGTRFANVGEFSEIQVAGDWAQAELSIDASVIYY